MEGFDPEQASVEVARAAVSMALTRDRGDEATLKAAYARQGVHAVAVDYGGDYLTLLKKGVERAVVAAEREGVIQTSHPEQGAVAGAAKEAFAQVMPKALGLSVGGKIGIARRGEHLTVAVFLGVGLLHLNEVAIGLGHRAVPDS
ncbi:MAG: HutP family protein [Symbiobacteriia bacterium]